MMTNFDLRETTTLKKEKKKILQSGICSARGLVPQTLLFHMFDPSFSASKHKRLVLLLYEQLYQRHVNTVLILQKHCELSI